MELSNRELKVEIRLITSQIFFRRITEKSLLESGMCIGFDTRISSLPY